MSTRATRGARRRTVVASVMIFAILVAFVIRLVDIQVVNAADHIADSENIGNLAVSDTIAGNRGSIVDSNGAVLASSTLVYDVELNPKVMTALEEDDPDLPWSQASEKIAAIIGQSADELRAAVAANLEANAESQYYLLAKGVDTEHFLELRDLGLAYMHWTARETRAYPNGAVAGNIVGYLNGEGTPQAGVEETEQECLAPTDGESSYKVGATGNVIPGSESVTDAVDGGTVQLTINSDLNWYLQQMIAEEVQAKGAAAGTVTVVEVKTGKIRAAAEYPTVDPNDLSASSSDDWTSKIFHSDFEPGSIFKPITAATLLDTGAATIDTTVSASGRETFPNGAGTINDAFSHAAHNYTLAGTLIDSSNVAMSKFGTLTDPQTRYDYQEKFGLGQKTIDFPGEVSGILNPVSEWDARSVYTTTFGQHLTVTAAQMAGAYQAIANGGEKIDLSLVESCTQADGTVVTPDAPETSQVISADTSSTVLRMLENVAVQGDLAKAVAIDGYRIGIKTGTAQVAGDDGEYKQGSYDVSMVGVAPIDDPQYVVLVTMKEPTKIVSSTATAAAFQKAMTQVLKTYRVAPSTTAMDELLPKYK